MKNFSQFLRVAAYKHSDASGLLNEANRLPGFCDHVRHAEPPSWTFGGPEAIQQAVAACMVQKRVVRGASGYTYFRKPRSDFRCVTTVIASYPVPTQQTRDSEYEVLELIEWRIAAEAFVKSEFNDHLLAICWHFDEGYPHLHGFAVGPAQHLHPGLRAELKNGVLIGDRKERVAAYRLGLSDLQDRFYEAVSKRFGHRRRGDGIRGARIKNRDLYEWYLKFEAECKRNGNLQLLRDFIHAHRSSQGEKFEKDRLSAVPNDATKYSQETTWRSFEKPA